MSGSAGVRNPDGSRVSDYDYRLPEDRVARYPAERRDGSRLLVVPRGGGPTRHLRFPEVVELFEAGDVLVVNQSKVIPARLLGRKPTGAAAEVLLLRPAGGWWAAPPSAAGREEGVPTPVSPRDDVWEALVRPGGKLKPGRVMEVADDLRVEILEAAPGGGRLVRLVCPGSVEEALERHGHIPLPPYLGREDEPLDRNRYQTVYARTPGSVAAPTAGLHFTPELLAALQERGVVRAEVTLHVGVGTFRPVEVEDPAEHELHHEWYDVTPEAAEAVNRARAAGGRVWAVGTTAVRTLEAVADGDGTVRPGRGSTDLFIRPPYRFRAVDCLLTNFHLPRSTLLMLVAAFGGYARVMQAYQEAVEGGYRFYSYGDAMAVVGRSAQR